MSVLKKIKADAALHAGVFLQELKPLPLYPEGRDLYHTYLSLHPKCHHTDEFKHLIHGSLAVFLELISASYDIDDTVGPDINPTVHFNTVSSYYWKRALNAAWTLENDRRNHTAKLCLARAFNDVGSHIYAFL